jgi:hypothetical protein
MVGVTRSDFLGQSFTILQKYFENYDISSQIPCFLKKIIYTNPKPCGIGQVGATWKNAIGHQYSCKIAHVYIVQRPYMYLMKKYFIRCMQLVGCYYNQFNHKCHL